MDTPVGVAENFPQAETITGLIEQRQIIGEVGAVDCLVTPSGEVYALGRQIAQTLHGSVLKGFLLHGIEGSEVLFTPPESVQLVLYLVRAGCLVQVLFVVCRLVRSDTFDVHFDQIELNAAESTTERLQEMRQYS